MKSFFKLVAAEFGASPHHLFEALRKVNSRERKKNALFFTGMGNGSIFK